MSDLAFLEQLVLRECDETDIPAITSIYRHVVLNSCATFEIDPPSEAELKIRRRLMFAARCPYLVAESAGKVAGYAYANSYRQHMAYSKTLESSIYVRDGMQGRGVGERLLAALIDEATKRGYRQMIAVIGDSGNRGAIRLHEKLGFAPIGNLRAVGWKHGRWLDTVLMQRPLGQGEAAPC